MNIYKIKHEDLMHRNYDELYDQLKHVLNECFPGDDTVVSLDKSVVFYGAVDGKIVSIVLCIRAEKEKFIIANVCTLPEYRKRGYATRIIQRVVKSDKGKFALRVAPTVSEQWYKNMGFSCQDEWCFMTNHEDTSE